MLTLWKCDEYWLELLKIKWEKIHVVNMQSRVNKSVEGKWTQVFIRWTWVDDYIENIAQT